MPRFQVRPIIPLAGALTVVALLCAIYRWVDPLPARWKAFITRVFESSDALGPTPVLVDLHHAEATEAFPFNRLR